MMNRQRLYILADSPDDARKCSNRCFSSHRSKTNAYRSAKTSCRVRETCRPRRATQRSVSTQSCNYIQPQRPIICYGSCQPQDVTPFKTRICCNRQPKCPQSDQSETWECTKCTGCSCQEPPPCCVCPCGQTCKSICNGCPCDESDEESQVHFICNPPSKKRRAVSECCFVPVICPESSCNPKGVFSDDSFELLVQEKANCRECKKYHCTLKEKKSVKVYRVEYCNKEELTDSDCECGEEDEMTCVCCGE